MWDFCAAEMGNFGHPFADIDTTPGWLMETIKWMLRSWTSTVGLSENEEMFPGKKTDDEPMDLE